MIVVDTHAWIWWAGQSPRLSAAAADAIRRADAIGTCAISCWEIALLVKRKRLKLDRGELAWIHQALALPRAVLLPLTPEIALRSASLPDSFPGDPADRLIVATAIEHRAALITRDSAIRSAQLVPTIW